MKISNAFFEAAAGLSKQLLPSEYPEVAFSGKSNVGKSSLINKLVNRKALARTSATPGKTATINFYRVDGVRFVDLPGYGYAKVAQSERLRWSELMEGYFNSDRDVRLVVQLVDMRHAPSADDLDMIHYLQQTGFPYIVVLTKADKLNKTEYKKQMDYFNALQRLEQIPQVIPFSAISGAGAADVMAAIEEACGDAE
jgi:GTP-binding protein